MNRLSNGCNGGINCMMWSKAWPLALWWELKTWPSHVGFSRPNCCNWQIWPAIKPAQPRWVCRKWCYRSTNWRRIHFYLFYYSSIPHNNTITDRISRQLVPSRFRDFSSGLLLDTWTLVRGLGIAQEELTLRRIIEWVDGRCVLVTNLESIVPYG